MKKSDRRLAEEGFYSSRMAREICCTRLDVRRIFVAAVCDRRNEKRCGAHRTPLQLFFLRAHEEDGDRSFVTDFGDGTAVK